MLSFLPALRWLPMACACERGPCERGTGNPRGFSGLRSNGRQHPPPRRPKLGGQPVAMPFSLRLPARNSGHCREGRIGKPCHLDYWSGDDTNDGAWVFLAKGSASAKHSVGVIPRSCDSECPPAYHFLSRPLPNTLDSTAPL
jgi:hypothetical protein